MERRRPDFEDDKLRAWRAGPDDELGEVKRDPTVLDLDLDLDLDLAHEEIFESTP